MLHDHKEFARISRKMLGKSPDRPGFEAPAITDLIGRIEAALAERSAGR